MAACQYCGPVATPHICPGPDRFAVPVPDELEELIVYLQRTWDIRFAEIIALECGPAAVRWAVTIVKRGDAKGQPYTHPAGLIVKLSRRLERASRRRR
jgi:hypothetical protein